MHVMTKNGFAPLEKVSLKVGLEATRARCEFPTSLDGLLAFVLEEYERTFKFPVGFVATRDFVREFISGETEKVLELLPGMCEITLAVAKSERDWSLTVKGKVNRRLVGKVLAPLLDDFMVAGLHQSLAFSFVPVMDRLTTFTVSFRVYLHTPH